MTPSRLAARRTRGLPGRPRRVWRHRQRPARDRRRLEDALKHLFEQEYRGRHASISSLAGALHLGDSAVVALVGRMQAQGLLAARGQEFDLTPAGERLALQVVRAHRLLERYFADEARLPLRRRPRGRRTARSTRSPRRGGSAVGVTRPPDTRSARRSDSDARGRGAAADRHAGDVVAGDTTGRIVHLEDEPEISFAQIVAEGLRVGQSRAHRRIDAAARAS